MSKIASHHERRKLQAIAMRIKTTSASKRPLFSPSRKKKLRASTTEPPLQLLRTTRERVLKRRNLTKPPWMGNSAISILHFAALVTKTQQDKRAIAPPSLTGRSIS
ncbi:hypothetical protein DEO72_LG1g2492 [Vigna unguiculata]|uniref:Uncharacterized protein n=1 Tax=Vigna unguiculata TaxID=3917 RepID=A0A4D6KLE0_VIGUN|nr:hypothetical protein DEO72_LG1g2492 [Vigna unguiculata]